MRARRRVQLSRRHRRQLLQGRSQIYSSTNESLCGPLTAHFENDSWGRPIRAFVGQLPAGPLTAFRHHFGLLRATDSAQILMLGPKAE